MDIEAVREYALSLNVLVTEELFAEQWISWRIAGKWFLLMQLDAPEPRVAVKLPPMVGAALRESHDGVRPAYHMNKVHWNDLYLNRLGDDFVKQQIARSFQLVMSKLPKKQRDIILAQKPK
ncbi:MAG: MmcQ/YjbR family DNA-binding protein [Muribaculaceae bacterium]|nr:MmcQ/YjbR family DNA-binding protein [Muribaculaceae bacterium]